MGDTTTLEPHLGHLTEAALLGDERSPIARGACLRALIRASVRHNLEVSVSPRSSIYLAALALAVVLPAGCKKAVESAESAALAAASGGKASLTADGKIEVKTDDGVAKIDLAGDKGIATVTGTNADGSKFNAAFGAAAKAPDGFPLPVMDGLSVVQAAVADKDGKKNYALMGTIAKPAKEVADFYEPAMKKAGLTVTRSETNLGGVVMLALSGEGGGHKMGVAVQEAKGQTTVTMGGDW